MYLYMDTNSQCTLFKQTKYCDVKYVRFWSSSWSSQTHGESTIQHTPLAWGWGVPLPLSTLSPWLQGVTPPTHLLHCGNWTTFYTAAFCWPATIFWCITIIFFQWFHIAALKLWPIFWPRVIILFNHWRIFKINQINLKLKE